MIFRTEIMKYSGITYKHDKHDKHDKHYISYLHQHDQWGKMIWVYKIELNLINMIKVTSFMIYGPTGKWQALATFSLLAHFACECM